MAEFRVTFGQQYPREEHPVNDAVDLPLAHHDGWWTIIAPTEDHARALVHVFTAGRWAFLYPAREVEEGFDETLFPLGETLRIEVPA